MVGMLEMGDKDGRRRRRGVVDGTEHALVVGPCFMTTNAAAWAIIKAARESQSLLRAIMVAECFRGEKYELGLELAVSVDLLRQLSPSF